ncbi:MAG: hypothetical protein MUF49_32280 [Oculatellaceae cyanobacterium Prado106]|jgi:NADPH:quinone reductase-like Zn-dependent oxidoreductase|nr:hypothetical protein [Oculatellaceae cyanobacterium Prado106]
MKALQVQKFADATAIHLQELADLQPTEQQVILRVRAAGVNPAGWYVVNGLPVKEGKRRKAKGEFLVISPSPHSRSD